MLSHLPRGRKFQRRCGAHLPGSGQRRAQALDLENSVRGSLKVFGLRIGTVTRRHSRRGSSNWSGKTAAWSPSPNPCCGSGECCSMNSGASIACVDKLARRDTVCRRLMTIPGVGTVAALTYRTGIDAPERFSRSRDVGAHFGLTPRRYSSGQTDYDGRISCLCAQSSGAFSSHSGTRGTRGTDGSNPSSSSGQSVSCGIFPSCIEKPAVVAGCAGPAGGTVGRDAQGSSTSRQLPVISLSGPIPVPQCRRPVWRQ
jgi:hypothetical protein